MVLPESLNQEYYKALVSRDETYKHKYIAAVKTTGIFCISTCYARKPKFENVEFYKDVASAKAAGFRACKLCKPIG